MKDEVRGSQSTGEGPSRWRWRQVLADRRERKAIKRREKKDSGWSTGGLMVTCPKCHKDIRDVERFRNAHRISCVRIPRNRPAGWGVRSR